MRSMEPTFFTAALGTLTKRVVGSGAGYGRKPRSLAKLMEDPGVLEASIVHSVHELVWTAVQGQMDEEARTASFMGHLATNLNWYALLAQWTAVLFPETKRVRPCNLYWAQQAKHVEAWRGGDFGVAVRMPEDRVRVALYQAKRCSAAGITTLYRAVADRNQADDKIREDDAVADLNSLRAPVRNDDESPLHQLHRLEIWRRRGLSHLRGTLKLDLPDHPWCRYAFWHDAPDMASEKGADCPTVRSSNACFEYVRNNLSNRRTKPFTIQASGSDFGELICIGDQRDLIVSLERARDLLGHMHDLNLPDFIGVDETGDGGIDVQFWEALFSKGGKTVSHIAGSGQAANTPQPSPPSTATPPAASSPVPKG